VAQPIDVLLAASGRSVAPEEKTDLEARLSAIVRDAEAAWPGLGVSPEDFARWLAARLPQNATPLARALDALAASDLYLACACASGNDAAVAAFERAFFSDVERAFSKLRANEAMRDDARQILREKLFVSKEGRPPKIAEYAGASPLRMWLRIAALRTLQNLVVRAPKDEPLESSFLEAPAVDADPELAHMRRHYRAEFEQAFARALAALDAGDRALLAQKLSDKLTQDQLAEAYGVHVNTIARWLARAKEALEKRVRKELSNTLKVNEAELASIFRLVASQIEVTLG
jgi:RNA polymerase sigma-70 factor, ECF subfamily